MPAYLLNMTNQHAFMCDFIAIAMQVLVQSSSISRACSKTVLNQTMFDVSAPLFVLVLLLTRFNMTFNLPPPFLVTSVCKIYRFHFDDSPSLICRGQLILADA